MLLGFAALAQAYSPNSDLTASGAIAALKIDPNASPVYSESYNLGATGLRGWIYIDRNNVGQEGLQTAQSRQILITVASTPGSAVLAVDDVLLGAMAGTSGVVPTWASTSSDCRKAMGAAITDAEKTGAGTLRVKRWRGPFPGTTTDVNIPITILGDYLPTAPYNPVAPFICPKSAAILANGIAKLNTQTLSGGWADSVSALALLAAVKPGDANYAAVQTKLATFAQVLAPANLSLSGCDTWNWGYINIFLSEYYLRTVTDGAPDASVLSGINKYTVALAKGQSKYGTFGHGGAEQHADGSLHGSISWYGPVNSAGLVANIAIVLGKKALQAGNIALDPEIDPAIERGSNFFASYVNKGSIPYGEHEPWSGGHASNGKDGMAAVMFGLQASRPVETEYFTRMSVAGWVGREYGHTGQGFSYIWNALGAAMGGAEAAAAHLNQVRWHLDLERRTDGSFVYDGGEQYGGGTTSGGTYLGSSSYYGLNPTACFVLTYSLPHKRLYVTGRNAIPANTLNSTKVANAVAAGTYERDCTGYSVATLIAALSEYCPVVRHDAAAELGKRTLTTPELNTLIGLITNGTMSADPNVRQGACEALGIRKPTSPSPLTALSQRLSDTDLWVRAKAANALKSYGTGANSQRDPMLTAFAANATDPDVIVWSDPIQIANGYLADVLFQTMASNTNALTGTNRTNLLYPALRAGLKQPDGMARMYLGSFLKNRLTLADVQAIAPNIVDAVAERSPADRMFSDVIRYDALYTLGKFKIEEGIPLALMVKEQTWHGDDWLPFDLLQNTYRGAAKDALPTLYKWQAHIPQFAADYSIGGCCPDRLTNITNKIASTIAAIENDTNPPALSYFKSVTASASPLVVTLPANASTVSAGFTDLDLGVGNFVWSKVSGAGAVTFNPSSMTPNTSVSAAFNTPGTYRLRVAAVDRSILDYNLWITYSLGYFDFQTYNELLAPVSQEVIVTVAPDTNRAPVPQNQSVATPLNTAVMVILAATDPDGNPITYSVLTPPTHGTLAGTPPYLAYTPTAGYTGWDTFTFKASDGKLDSVVGAISIDVGGVGNRRPVAVNQSVTTPEETSKAINLTGSDPDGNPLIYDLVSGPSYGTLSGTAPNLTYQPAANFPASNFNGMDSFTFTVRDAALTSAVATVSVTVTPANDGPQATPQNVNAAVNVANGITLTGTDGEGYGMLFAVVANPTHGTLTGTAPNLSYRPTTNYHGPDSFTFRVTDSEGAVSTTATVSITVVNDPPLANPQSVDVTPNIAKAIILTGSDNCNDPLTYAVVAQPTQGVLSGTAPNLTYTPTNGYNGTDSFTFRVNDGTSNSPVATVSLNVVQWQTWTNIAPGAWSAGASWSGGVAPPATGSSSGLLIYNTTPYATSSSNDLAGTFVLNRASFGSALPSATISGNTLSFALNGAAFPQFHQNSANGLTVSNNLALAANTTVGGSGSGAVTLSGVISGTGSLTKTNSGILTIGAAGNNTFSGGIAVSTGTLVLNLNRLGLGSGSVTLAGGTTFYTANFEGNSSGGALPNTFNLSSGKVKMFTNKDIWITGPVTGSGGLEISGNGRTPGVMLSGAKSFSGGVTLMPTNGPNPTVSVDNLLSLGTGTLSSHLTSTSIAGNLEARTSVTTAPGVANPINLEPGCRLVVKTDGSNHLWLSGPITNSGSLNKIGTANLTLSGVNTYTGTTTITAGTLICSSPTALGRGPVVINGGGARILSLNFTGTRQVASLSLNGVLQANGTYGSTASPAANKNNTYFSGTGTLIVGPFATSTTVASSVNPAALGVSVTFTATVSGGAPTGYVTFFDGATALGTSALNGSYQASFATSSLAGGTHTITAQYSGDASCAGSTSTALSQVIALAPYDAWAANPGNGLAASVNDGPLADPEFDGLSNLMEFILGGGPSVSSTAALPTLTRSGNNWLFEYNRSDAAQPVTVQVVEYGSNFSGWTPVVIPATSGGSVTITPGSPSDHVTVTIPNLGPNGFVRLKVFK